MNGLQHKGFEEPSKPPIYVGILAVGHASQKRNEGCQKLQETLHSLEKFQPIVKIIRTVAADENTIKNVLCDWSDNLRLNLILTTGGTGFAFNDVTPEATRAIIHKEALAMMTAVTIASLKVTKNAMLSRAVCGIRNNALIINFPRSAKASCECLDVVLPALPFALSLLVDDNYESISHIQNTNQVSSMQSSSTCQCNFNPSMSRWSSPITQPRSSKTTARRRTSVSSEMQSNSSEGASHEVSRHTMAPTGHHFFNTLNLQEELLANSIRSSTPQISFQSSFQNDFWSENEHFSGGSRETHLLHGHHQQNNIQFELLEQQFKKVARRNRSSQYSTISMPQALSLIMNNSSTLPTIRKNYKDAYGFVLAEDVLAQESYPPFSSSAIDGYAVKASETHGNCDVIKPNEQHHSFPLTPLSPGKIVKVLRGDPLPVNADAVIAIEETLLLREDSDGEYETEVQVIESPNIGQNIIPAGCQIQSGEVVLSKGRKLDYSEIGILASVGTTNVLVHEKPVVAVFSTGKDSMGSHPAKQNNCSELDSSRIILLLSLQQNGFETIDLGISDDPSSVIANLLSRSEKADVIVSCGGVSLGENDYIKPILENIGADVHFGRVLISPGKLTTFATLHTQHGRKSYFALPGSPDSIIVTYNLFVLPSLCKMIGQAEPQTTVIRTKISYDVRLSQMPRCQRIRLRWKLDDPIPWADATSPLGSSTLTGMIGASALAVFPSRSIKQSTITSGQLVNAIIVDQL